jgi:multiple sugar transport system permease protein/raffinose/stachyose/melibiose transport system permease protein
VGYLLALLYVFSLRRASGIIRTLVFFPVVLPTVAVAALFSAIFAIAPQPGLINSAAQGLGLNPTDYFSTAGSAFVVLVIMDVWRSMGFYAVLLYAGLVDIPEDLLESARIDGATGLKMFRHIVLPLSLPVLLSAIIFSVNGTLKVFDSVIALTNGGPGTETSPLTVYMFRQAFSYGEYGYGATVATLLTMVCLVVTVFIFRSTRRDLTK